MNITKTTNGILLSDIVSGQRVKMQYIGYSKTEAKRLFKKYVKSLNPKA